MMESNASGGGIGIIGVLQIVFIVLKLCGVIDWSWFFVLLPSIIGIAAFFIGFIIFLAIRKR